jgi:hypothetical protein
LPFVTDHPAVNLDTLDDWAAAERLADETLSLAEPGPA